jgi:PKD repeat protein
MGWDCGPNINAAAGGLVIIRYNTVQVSAYYAVRIRGIPHTHCYVEHNWFYATTQSASVQQDLDGWGLSEYQKMTVNDNWYGTSTPPGTPTPPTGYPPIASFTGSPLSGYDPLTVAFTDKSANTPTTWAWNFGDGSTSAAKNPSHTYTSEGTYTVTLTVTNAYGSNSETETGYITVAAAAGVVDANFTGTPTSGDNPLTVTFTDTSTGVPTNWLWDFGDSSGTDSTQNPTHIYTEPGIYTVSLTAWNGLSTDTESKEEYVSVTATTGGIQVGTTSLSTMTYPYQRRLFYGNGRFWMFYSDGSNLVYKSSITGNYWGDSTIVLTGVTANSRVTTYYDGTYLHIAYAPGVSSSSLAYRRYECMGDGTLVASAAWQTAKAAAAGITYYNTSICIDGSGHPVIAYLHYIDALGTSTPYVIKNTQTNGTWVTDFDYQLNAAAATVWRVAVVASQGDTIMAIYGYDGQTVKSKVWNTGWLGENATASKIETGSHFSAVTTTDNVVHLVFCEDATEDITYTHYHVGGLNWEAEETIYNGTNTSLSPVLEKDNLDYLYCFWLEDPTGDHIYYTRQIAGVWEVAATDWMTGTSIVSASNVTGGYQQSPGNYLSLAWLAGTSSPYSIRFAYLEGATPSFYEGEYELDVDSSNECWDSALITASVNSDNISAGVRWVLDECLVWDTVAHDNPGNMAPASTTYSDYWQGSTAYTDNFDIIRYITGLAQGTICHVRFGVQWSDSTYWTYSDELAFEVDDIGGTLITSITQPSENISQSINGVHWSFESIVPTSDSSVNFVRILAYRSGSPTTMHVSLYDEDPVTFVPTGTALATGDADVSDITTDNVGEWVVVGFDADVPMTVGNNYDLVVTQESSTDNVYWICSNSAGLGYYASSDNAGVTWTYDPGPTVRDALYQLWDCEGTGSSTLHIIDADYNSISLGWQESLGLSYVLVYKTSGYPSSVTDGTLVYSGEITSATAENLTSGRTYYFSLWSYLTMPCSDETFFSTTPAYIASTTTAGLDDPDWSGEATDYDVDSSILANGRMGDLISFLARYGELPIGTVGLLGYSSILMFGMVGLASYNRSVLATLGFAIIGMLLGNALGVIATAFLIIAVIAGATVGYLRGGQPT